LFNTNNSFQEVKKLLLNDFNITSIVSLPVGIFLPYSGVKTNIIFFEKTTATKKIRYYEVDPARKLTKNKPITYNDMSELVKLFKDKPATEKSRYIDVADIKDYDLSAKNPAKIKVIIHRSLTEILADIEKNNEQITISSQKLKNIL